MTLRNPRTVPVARLEGREIARDANGRPLDAAESMSAAMAVYAGLITDWHVYDATVGDGENDDQPPLPLPATEQSFAKLPLEIQDAVADEVAKRRNHTKTPPTSN